MKREELYYRSLAIGAVHADINLLDDITFLSNIVLSPHPSFGMLSSTLFGTRKNLKEAKWQKFSNAIVSIIQIYNSIANKTC